MDRRALNDTQTNGPPAATPLTPVALHVLIAGGDAADPRGAPRPDRRRRRR